MELNEHYFKYKVTNNLIVIYRKYDQTQFTTLKNNIEGVLIVSEYGMNSLYLVLGGERYLLQSANARKELVQGYNKLLSDIGWIKNNENN